MKYTLLFISSSCSSLFFSFFPFFLNITIFLHLLFSISFIIIFVIFFMHFFLRLVFSPVIMLFARLRRVHIGIIVRISFYALFYFLFPCVGLFSLFFFLSADPTNMMRSPQTRGPMMAWAGVPDAFMVSDDEEQDSDDDTVRSFFCSSHTRGVF